jgi:hypothetical protein
MSTHIRATPADDDFREWFIKMVNMLKGMSEKIIITGEQHMPMLYAFEHDGHSLIIAIPEIAGTDDKDVVAMLHKQMGKDTARFAGVIFLIEAWAAYLTPAELKAVGSVKNHPDRREILQFNGIRGTMQLMADFSIDRETRTLGPMNLRDPSTGSTGRFIVGDDGKLDS